MDAGVFVREMMKYLKQRKIPSQYDYRKPSFLRMVDLYIFHIHLYLLEKETCPRLAAMLHGDLL
ncbi:MAG: hypothetical protein AOA65_1478 [Candidatus Bathyarchaeota archaeon BA1]|nr:MAG: hypothetical protein AOA65_1478 [Candidatus Bathyarchaeota archaeon BA1]